MESINFTANRIKNVNIARKYYNSYKPCRVSLVEMDPANQKDIDAIYKITDKWDESFTAFTYDDMRTVKANPELKSQLHVYALTTQNSDFDKIKPSKILGVAEIVERYSDGNKIEVLQTNPDFIKGSFNEKPKFKNIGKQLVSFVKKAFGDKPLYLNPTCTAVPFYEKLGFVPSVRKNILCISPKS